jgi:DNA mismatch repair protein MutS
MNESDNILNNATKKSLIILDEIGRGTSTFDGLSLAWAITEYIHNNKNIKARTLFATHYHELIYLADNLSGAFNLNVEVIEQNDKIIFLRKIKDGGASKSYGIQVAEMAGLPNKIIIRAKDLLFDFMNNKTKYSKINTKRKNSQLDLFDKDSKLLKKIKELDIDSISPIDALNILNDLKNDS